MNQPARLIPNLAWTTLLALFSALYGAGAIAETVYVTDELRLGLYDTEQTSGRPFKTLTSGDALEVLERSLMSIRVRTEDNEEGWVKTAYIVSEEPGRRRAEKLAALNAELQTQLAAAEAEVSTAEGRIDELQTSLADASTGIETLPALQAENARLSAEIAASGSRIPMNWAVIAAVLALIGGFAIGYFWLDRRVRRQFGGVRVY